MIPAIPISVCLALGERFVVTGDSLSMLVEVARLRRPLAIAALPRAGALSRLIPGKSRDISALHTYLRQGGWAVKLGQPFIAPPQPPPDDIEMPPLGFCHCLTLRTKAAPRKISWGKIGGCPERLKTIVCELANRTAKIVAGQNIDPSINSPV